MHGKKGQNRVVLVQDDTVFLRNWLDDRFSISMAVAPCAEYLIH